MCSKDDLYIGKLIKLSDAANRLAKKDNGDLNLYWTMRFCREQFIQFAIKVPYLINSLEWEFEPNELKGPDEIHGDIINTRTGVFFLDPLDIEDVIQFSLKEFETSGLYIRNENWNSGFMKIKIVSDYETWKKYFANEKKEDGIRREKLTEENSEYDKFNRYLLSSDVCNYKYEQNQLMLDSEDRENNFIRVKINDVFVLLSDFENALNDKGFDQRKSNSLDNLHREPKLQETWMLHYVKENNIDIKKEITDQQMKDFRKAAIDKGMTENSFKTMRRKLNILGIDRSKKK